MMHRITVVTGASASTNSPHVARSSSGSSRHLVDRPSSPVPALDVVSDDSSGGEPSYVHYEQHSQHSFNKTMTPPAGVRKVSNWRKRGMQHVPHVKSDQDDEVIVALDHSLMKRRDLPIKLVVDDPVPVENYYDDPCTQAFANHVRRGPTKRRSHRNRSSRSSRSSNRLREEQKEKSTSRDKAKETSGDDWFADFTSFDVDNNQTNFDDVFDNRWINQEEKEGETFFGKSASFCEPERTSLKETTSTESTTDSTIPCDLLTTVEADDKNGLELVEKHPREKAQLESETPDNSTSPSNISIVASSKQNTKQDWAESPPKLGEDQSEIIIRFSGPVVRVQYEGEMVSVSEQTAVKLKHGACAWV